MLHSIIDWIEYRACILAYIVVRIAGIYWVVVLAAKFFTREPLLYLYSRAEYTQETVPVMAVLVVELIAFIYQLLTRTAFGRAMDSVLLFDLSPKISAASTIVFVMWVSSKPAPGARYLPLAALTAVSILGAVAVRWGRLARDSERARVAISPGGEPEEAATAVTRMSVPTRTFADIHGNAHVKERLLLAANAVIQADKKTSIEPARNGILLHGAPGNGKTVFAEALAGELRLPLLTLSYGDVASRWVGEKTSRVRAAFQEAVRGAPCVLLIDEVDSFLESRGASGAGALKEDRDLVNALLTLMVDIRQSKVLLIAATNHLERLDPAAVREGRFDFKIEIPPPDLHARAGLLRQRLGELLPNANLASELIDSVARRWNGYSTKRILAIAEELPAVLRRTGRTTPDFKDFMYALRAVQGHAALSLDNVRDLASLVLSDRTRLGIRNVVTRMADPEDTERHGGTLPTGIIFAGPPGTGKTAAAKALAKELGWTFLPATGAELSRDVDALNRLYVKAKDLRPAIIFVDECDELLRHREFSGATQATNKLLTIMDGAADRVRDVVWIAATNHLDQIDPAMLRAGRFTEKVMFELPAQEAVEAHLTEWLHVRNVVLEPGLVVAALVEMMGEVSVANAEGVAQAAVNLAISRGTRPVLITRQDVAHAIELVIG
jgi:transitional endoplasmic reticulum ATPase